MKKLIIPFLAIIAMAFVSSCNKDNKSEATISYYAVLDSIHYTAEGDTLYYDTLKAIQQYNGITMTPWQERASTEYSSSISYVNAMCDEQAIVTFKNKISEQTLDDIRQTWYKKYYKDSEKTINDVPVSEFTAYYSIYNIAYNTPLVSEITKVIK